jgi:hypothetical protein
MSFGTKSSYQHKSSATRMDIKWGKTDFSLRKKKSNFDEAMQFFVEIMLLYTRGLCI